MGLRAGKAIRGGADDMMEALGWWSRILASSCVMRTVSRICPFAPRSEEKRGASECIIVLYLCNGRCDTELGR